MSDDRRAFGSIPKDEAEIARQEGIVIYKLLRQKYKDSSTSDYDMILNTLCVSLICLIKTSCPPDNYPYMFQIIHKILQENLK